MKKIIQFLPVKPSEIVLAILGAFLIWALKH